MENTRGALRAARRHGGLVQVRRRRGLERLDAVVVEVGSAWVLLSQVSSTLVLDGTTAVRIKDVTGVEPFTSFLQRSLESEGIVPVQPELGGEALSSTRALLRALRGKELVQIELERDHRDMSFIGEVMSAGKEVALDEVDAEARWTGVSFWPRRRITRVEFRTRYVERLSAVAGDRP